MKKNYVYLIILLGVTVCLTLLLASIYKNEVTELSYLYEKINKITSNEFEEYIMENPDTIIYISNKNNLDINKFEKKLFKKLEKLNLLENIVYLEKSEIDKNIEEKLKKDYSYKYNEEKLPVIIVINDGLMLQISVIDSDSNANTIINYEVFE